VKPAGVARTATAALLLLLPAWAAADAAEPAAALWAALSRGGHVAMMRHANAPGTDDPPGFRIGDCATQRNLDDGGRAQARRAGEAFRRNGLPSARVLASEWCRCQETARLLGIGSVETLPALNSLHGRGENEERQVTALRRFLGGLPADGPSVVLVSHQATISALTGAYPQSSAIVVLALKKPGGFEVAGSIPPP
jgi:broad specificity phosphatase PhoE